MRQTSPSPKSATTYSPLLNVPSDDYAYPVGFDLNDLKTLLAQRVTATDNVDGNLSTAVQINYGSLSTAAVGSFDVDLFRHRLLEQHDYLYSIVLIANLVDSGYLTDPTFQRAGDGQWKPKSNDGVASIAYNATQSVMNITVTSLGGWASAAGAYFSGSAE
ncbi:MAG: hypothetical protein MZU97_20130 [Bacillus subtilis]|nr:hypothetical protein [Bacillus subtilis]